MEQAPPQRAQLAAQPRSAAGSRTHSPRTCGGRQRRGCGAATPLDQAQKGAASPAPAAAASLASACTAAACASPSSYAAAASACAAAAACLGACLGATPWGEEGPACLAQPRPRRQLTRTRQSRRQHRPPHPPRRRRRRPRYPPRAPPGAAACVPLAPLPSRAPPARCAHPWACSTTRGSTARAGAGRRGRAALPAPPAPARAWRTRRTPTRCARTAAGTGSRRAG